MKKWTWSPPFSSKDNLFGLSCHIIQVTIKHSRASTGHVAFRVNSHPSFCFDLINLIFGDHV